MRYSSEMLQSDAEDIDERRKRAKHYSANLGMELTMPLLSITWAQLRHVGGVRL